MARVAIAHLRLEDEMTNSPSSTSRTSSSQSKSASASATSKPAKSSTSSTAARSMARGQKPSSRSASLASSSSSLSTNAERKRAHCGATGPQLEYVTRSFGKGAALLVIEGIPMWSCARCGESYFTARTMHEIERIKALWKSVTVSRSVSVAAFEAAGA